MRYRANKRRLELQVEEPAIEDVVLAVYSMVVPRYTKKLYFVPESECPWIKLTALAKQRKGFSIIHSNDWPSNLNDRFRVTQDGSVLYVVPGDGDKLAEEDLERIALSLPRT